MAMSEARETLSHAAYTIAEIAGYIHKFQASKTKVTNRELNHIVEQCQRASAQIGEAISQMPEESNEP